MIANERMWPWRQAMELNFHHRRLFTGNHRTIRAERDAMNNECLVAGQADRSTALGSTQRHGHFVKRLAHVTD